jgi:hypothetical protein
MQLRESIRPSFASAPQDGGPPSDPPENVVASDSQRKDSVNSMCD